MEGYIRLISRGEIRIVPSYNPEVSFLVFEGEEFWIKDTEASLPLGAEKGQYFEVGIKVSGRFTTGWIRVEDFENACKMKI